MSRPATAYLQTTLRWSSQQSSLEAFRCWQEWTKTSLFVVHRLWRTMCGDGFETLGCRGRAGAFHIIFGIYSLTIMVEAILAIVAAQL